MSASGDAVAAALDGTADALDGLVWIGCPSMLIDEVILALEPLLTAHAGLRVELKIHDRILNPISDGLDIAIWGGRLPDSTLISKRLVTIQLVLAATEGYLRRFETPTTPQELSRHRIVRLSSPRPYITLTDADGEQHRVDTLAQLETNDSRTAQRAVRAGLGIGLSSTRALHRDPHLRRVMADYRLPRISLAAIYAPAMKRSARIQAVVAGLQKSLETVASMPGEAPTPA